MIQLVIWAQSVCRSTMALYREVKRQAGVPVTVVVRQSKRGERARQMREAQGQGADEFADVVDVEWDGELESGRGIFAVHSGEGAVHVFSGCQVSAAVRGLMQEAHEKGLRVAVYDEAPCEMCVGVKALLKRIYYRWVLPYMVRDAIKCADLFLNASGRKGIDRLVQLGWDRSKIVPFGYVSEVTFKFQARKKERKSELKILHTGIETPYRDVSTLKNAASILESKGLRTEVVCTGGGVPPEELNRFYGWADVFVACGLCEPWGMRVNDAIHAGLPVLVSSGMGVEWLVKQYGCGGVFHKGSAQELAKLLEWHITDDAFRSKSLSGVSAAHEAWTPESRAKDLMAILMS